MKFISCYSRQYYPSHIRLKSHRSFIANPKKPMGEAPVMKNN